MLKIKLIRYGKKNQPHYRFVVQEAKTKRDGKYVVALGHYAPAQDPKELEIDLAGYKKWLSQGAQPTETVASLVKRYQSDEPFPPKKKKVSKKQQEKTKQAKTDKKAEKKADEKKKEDKKKKEK